MADLPDTFVPGFHYEEKVRKMKYNVFGNTGLKVSQLSLGTGGFCLAYGQFTLEECKATLHEAIKSGINYIDTAPYYGYGVSEEVLGKCLEGLPREAYYIATKVGRYESDPQVAFDLSAEKTTNSINTSLKRLGLEYIDVLQVHDIEFDPSLDRVLNETLPAIERARKEGKVRFIGVTGYPVSVLADCVKRSTVQIDMILSYARLTLLNDDLKEFLPFFLSNNLGVVNAAAHSLGLLTNGGPQPWQVAYADIKEGCTEAREYCKSKGIELGRLALYYSLQQSGPHTHLVGMNTRTFLGINLDVYYNGITGQEQQAIDFIKTRIFSKLKRTSWEGKEIGEYKQLLAERTQQ